MCWPPRTRSLAELKHWLLASDEGELKEITPGLSSDAIVCPVQLMRNDELIAIGQKIFSPFPGSEMGAGGYRGARIQPHSPTDNVSDICGWAIQTAFSARADHSGFC